MKKRYLALFLTGIVTLGTLFPGSALAEADDSGLTLKQVVVLSRHNIRSPLSEKGSMIGEITPHEWFPWTSRTGELSLKGAMLETTMGQYFRLWLEDEGLFPENYIPEDGVVRFYANGLQRTQATAHYFSTGLLPVCVVPIERHGEYNEADNTFLPKINYMTDEYAMDILDEIAEGGGQDGLSGYRRSLDESFNLIADVTDMNESEIYTSGKYGDFLADDISILLEEGSEPAMTGTIKTATSLADALVLQYYEEPDDLKAAFGHELSFEDWQKIGTVLSTYETILFTSPLLAANLAHPIMEEVYKELNTEGRAFSFLCGHDSTITSFLAALGVKNYAPLPNAVEPTTPIGIKLVFERWVDQEDVSFFKVVLVYQSADQLRSIQPLSLEVPPMIVPVFFEGIETDENGMIAEADLMDLLNEKINYLYEIEETYALEEEEAA